MAEIKWIKIATNIFDDEKLLLIENLPDADAIIVIWFKLLCMAGKQNNNGVFLMNDKIAYTDEMLATIFRKSLNVIKLALATFNNFGMIEIIDNVITIPNWEKHQNIDTLEKLKEQNRKRVALHRERQKTLIPNNNENECNVTSNVTEHYSNALERERDKERDKEYNNIYIDIVEYLNAKTNSSYRYSSEKTKRVINARLNEGFNLDDFKKVIDIKCTQWLGDEKMEQYLRPETLFGTKFESYLNTKVNQKEKKASGEEYDILR